MKDDAAGPERLDLPGAGDETDVTVIEKGDAFVFGYSKIDVMFGRATPEAVRLPYRNFVKPGVRFVQETITAIDPALRSVTTTGGSYEADFLVLALGADYDLDATRGLTEDGHDFYSLAGASRLREVLPAFCKGPAIVGVSGFPYKCPPAPSECALILHHYLATRGVRSACEITLVISALQPDAVDRRRAYKVQFGAQRRARWFGLYQFTAEEPEKERLKPRFPHTSGCARLRSGRDSRPAPKAWWRPC